MNKFIIVPALVLISAVGCKKKESVPAPPSIAFVAMDKQEVRAGSEDIVYMQFAFSDGDGDVESAQISFIDTRDTTDVISYPFPDFDVEGINLPDKTPANGKIEIALQAAFMLNRTDTIHKFRDTLIYKVYMTDNSGKQSNRVELPPIYLNQ